MNPNILRTSLAALALTIAVSGCGNNSLTLPDGTTNSSGAPALPSVSTMRFDLDFFGVAAPAMDAQSLATGKPSETMLQSAGGGDHENWINAYVRAIFVYLTTFDLLEEPIGAFAYAIHSVPQKQSDGSYLWTYIFVDQTIEYSVFLYATPLATTTEWRMEVSSNDPAQPLNHFLWFSGESQNDDQGGYWQFYEPVNMTDGVESARIDWANGAENTMTISVNGATQEDLGDYLTFTESKVAGSIEYYDASASELSNILWHGNGSGSLTAPDFNGGATACWDHLQRNVACE